MTVRQEHGVEFAALEFGFSAILCFLRFPTLEHPAIDENARVFRHDMVRRAGDVPRCTMKMNLHQISQHFRLPISDCQLISITRCQSAIGNWQWSKRPSPFD